jgi:hypothetical protein
MTPHIPRLWSTALGLCTALLLGGCALSRYETSISDTHSAISQRTEQANALLRNYPGPTPAVVNSQTPRFTTQSIPLDRNEMLPNHIASVTLRIPGRHNIKTIAALIERATEIPVQVTSDATMSAAMFVPIGMGQMAEAPAAAVNPLATPTAFTAPNDKSIIQRIQRAGGNKLLNENDPATQNDIEVNYSGSLAGLLNQVSLRSDLRWSYESGRIKFYRVVSRTIAVKTLPGGLKLSSSLSLSSTGGGTASSSTASDINIWTGIEKNLANMVSVSGKLVIDQNTGTVTVRDAFRNVETVEQYVQSLRKQLDKYLPFNLYRDFASSMLMISLASLMRSGISLRSSLERTYKHSSPWGKWHIRQILINLSKPSNGTFGQAFNTGLFDQELEDRIQDASERSNPIEAFIHIGVGSIDRMILRIEKRAKQLNNSLMVICGVLLAAMMLAFFSTTMSLQSGIRNPAQGIIK